MISIKLAPKFIFRFSIFALLFFLIFLVIYQKSGTFKENQSYQRVASKAKEFYKIHNNMEIDEYFLWRRIVEINPEYENKKLFLNLDKKMRRDPFYRIIDDNSHGDIRIGKNFDTNKDIQNLFVLKIFYNQFYFGNFSNFLTDPWDDIMLNALYCDKNNFDNMDWEVLNLLRSGKGDYFDTHFLLGLLLLEKNQCYDTQEIKNAIKDVVYDIARAQKNDSVFSDIYVERIVFLNWAGRKDLVEKEWIEKVIKSFDDEKHGWSDAGSPVINAHTTGLAILSLEYFKNTAF